MFKTPILIPLKVLPADEFLANDLISSPESKKYRYSDVIKLRFGLIVNTDSLMFQLVGFS